MELPFPVPVVVVVAWPPCGSFYTLVFLTLFTSILLSCSSDWWKGMLKLFWVRLKVWVR